jgi:hypothetical protein
MRAISYVTIYSEGKSKYFFSQSLMPSKNKLCLPPQFELLLEFALQTI